MNEDIAIDFIEPAAQDIGENGNPIRPLFSIAISMKRIADDVEQIKNGMKFICERWKT